MSVSCAAGSLRAGSTLLVVNGLVEIDENMRWTIIKSRKDWTREMVEFANAHEDCLKKSLHSSGVSKLKRLFQSVFESRAFCPLSIFIRFSLLCFHPFHISSLALGNSRIHFISTHCFKCS